MEKKIDEKVLEVQKWLNKHYIDILTSSEYGRVEENGQTSWNVLNGLIIALQHELEIKDLSPTFGPQTYEKLLALGNLKINTKSKIIPIIQGACWVSGYSGGSKHGTFDLSMGRGIRKLQADLGINQDGIINAKLLKALFTMNAYIKLPNGYDEVRKFQHWLNRTYASKTKFHYIPCDGVYSRETQEGIIYAIQYECQLDDVANGWFGPTTSAKLYEKTKETINNNFKNKNLEKIFVGLFACYNNGIGLIYNRLGTTESKEKIKVFQKFTKINVNGAANFETWCELLVSTGDPNRHTEAIDYSFKYSKVDGHGPITQDDITMMKNDGIKYVGRYLTNECGLEPVEERCWDKELKIEERDMLLANGISIFPIYQTEGSIQSYFNYKNGTIAGEKARELAQNKYKIPFGTTIYFTIDYDCYNFEVFDEIKNQLGPVGEYFKGIKSTLQYYNIGVYGSRNVCSLVSKHCDAIYSFVSGMSIGYSGNLGYPLPANWSFNQIKEDVGKKIDYVVVRGNDKCFSKIEDVVFKPNDFIKQVIIIYNEFIKQWPSDDINETNKKVCNFYRSLNSNYTGKQSKYIWGSPDLEINQLINKKCFDNLKILLEIDDLSAHEKIELTHLFASTYGYLHHGISNVQDVGYNDIGAWAGDLVTLLADYTNQKENNNNIKEFFEKYCGTNIDSSYSVTDYLADVDAINLATLLTKNIPIYIVLQNYYFNGGCKRRYNDEFSNRFNSNDQFEKEIVKNLLDVAENYENNAMFNTHITFLYSKKIDKNKKHLLIDFKVNFSENDIDQIVEAYCDVKRNFRMKELEE